MELWYPDAFRLDGPAGKQGYTGIRVRQGKGAIYHSAEGEWRGLLAVLESTRKASWHLSLLTSGAWMQHYPLNAVCWHGGCVFANANFVGVECEGRVGEPLTRAQIAALAEFTAWLAEEEDWAIIQRHVTLREHREMAEYGADPTACPSGRIPWEEIINMATQDKEAREEARKATFRQHIAGLILSGDEKLSEQAYMEMKYVRGLAGKPI